MDYRVLLYYNYTTIEDPEAFAKEHLAFCRALDIKGRILVAPEGINGTLSGTKEATEQYMAAMLADERFKDTYFKSDESEGHAFKKLFVRPRTELVALNLEEDIDPRQMTGNYLEPQAFREALLAEDTVVIDARNDYEYDLGHFRGAIRPEIHNFRELPNGFVRTRNSLWIKKSSPIVPAAFAVRNSLAGCCEKALKMLHSFMGASRLMGKTKPHKGSFGTEKCMSLMNESVSRSIRSTRKSSGKNGSMGPRVNATSIAATQNAIAKCWFLKKTKKNIWGHVRLHVLKNQTTAI
jgi:UPF0176 protein